jgi:hypothetical protein
MQVAKHYRENWFSTFLQKLEWLTYLLILHYPISY